MYTGHMCAGVPALPVGAHVFVGTGEKRNAMIFVHGFNGQPLETWLLFQTLIDDLAADYPGFVQTDLFFYKYRSITQNIPVLAGDLLSFIRRVYPAPEPGLLGGSGILNGDDARPALSLPSGYESLVLVGHSMGCVLIRQAIVELLGKNGFDRLETTQFNAVESAIAKAEVCLFAPAHCGFEPTNVAGYFYSLIEVVPGLRNLCHSNAVHKDLKVESSFLSELRRRTELLANAFPWATALRSRNAFGRDEHVVRIERYDCDPANEFVRSQDHSSVCKPTLSYQFPLRFVHGRTTTTAA